MNPSLKRRVLFVLAGGLALPGLAQAGQVYDCPQQVRLTSIAVAGDELPGGMRAIASMPQLPFTGVRLFDGAPDGGGAVLKPASVQRGGSLLRWKAAKLAAGSAWLACEYADGVVRVVAQVQAAASCTATVARADGPDKAAKAQMVCQ